VFRRAKRPPHPRSDPFRQRGRVAPQRVGMKRRLRSIGSGAGDCAPAPSHTTERAVFSIRRLDPAEFFHHQPAVHPGPALARVGRLPRLARAWVGPESRPQLSRSAVSRVRSCPDQSLAWLCLALRPFALPCFRTASSLLWPLLTSSDLSAQGSPWVSADPVPSRRRALPAPSLTFGLRACSPARPRSLRLSARSCSFGRRLASGPSARVPYGSRLAVRLRLSSYPDGNLSSR
jgi:hypothetical protein